jgi:uncharacterized protein (TIGR03435 family)
MLQALLEDRFRLQVHRETRELPIYNFVLARGGLKMSADQTPPDPSKGFITFDSDPAPSAPLPRGAIHMGRTPSGTTLSGTGVAVALLMNLLQGQSDRIIIDKTDFKGLLDIQLRFTDVRSTEQSDSTAPSLFTAIQDLGLKLESAKATIEVVVIDSVQKLTEN